MSIEKHENQIKYKREKKYTHRRTDQEIMFQVLHFYFENEIVM